MKKRSVALLCAVMMIVGIAAGGTIAWLTDHTAEVKNTFTVGTIDIDLTESKDLDLKMTPGKTITKDPKVTVTDGSEDSYVFVKIEKSENYDEFLEDYAVTDEWKLVTKEGNVRVYYREYEATTGAAEYPVLKDDQVKVLTSVTKAQMDAVKAGTTPAPTLTFTAYAIQSADLGTTDISTIWAMAQEGAAPQG